MGIPFGLWSSVVVGMVVVAAAVAQKLWRVESPPAAALVVAWLGLAAGLGAAGVFATDGGTLVPVIAVAIAGPVVAGGWALLRSPAVRDLADRFDLPWLVGVQTYRAVGVVFLVGWGLGLLPGVFALPAGIGDVAIGLAAPFVARAVWRDPAGGRRAALLWNVAGLADLVVAVTLGFLSAPSQLQQLALSDPNLHITRMPFVLVPVFAVPLSVLLHLVSLRRLTASAPQPAGRVRPALLP